MKVNIETVTIDGTEYLTVSQFAAIVKKSDQLIHRLTVNGNTVRKLKSRNIAGRVLIPLSELTEFPFKLRGGSLRTYTHKPNGERVYQK